MERAWRHAHASVMGSSHHRSGAPCQDASTCALVRRPDEAFLVAAVADGAGSARHSQVGARLACHLLIEELEGFLAGGDGPEALEPAFVRGLLGRLRLRVARSARRLAVRPRELACTLLGAVVGPRSAAFLQVGDGAIVFAPRGGPREAFEVAFPPQRGEYANETVFATDPRAEAALAFRVLEQPVEELALFSDGLQNLVLDARSGAAHGRFFEPMFTAVRHARPGHSPGLAGALARFLASANVRRRTDDDTSLVLASRRVPEPAPALPTSKGSTPIQTHGPQLR